MATFEDYIRIKNSKNEFAKMLGIRTIEMKTGYAKGELDMKSCFANSMGTMHGGCMFSLGDTICGLAAASYGFHSTTVSGSLNYLRPGVGLSKMVAEAKVVKHGKTLSVFDVYITDEKETLLAKGTFTYYNLGKPLVNEEAEK